MREWIAIWCRVALMAALAGASLTSLAGPLVLAPERAGQYNPGTGVDAVFLKVHDDWRQSSVLWNEGTGEFGSGVPVSRYGWGTGLWGLADWQTAHHSPSPGMIEFLWSGRVSQIAFGDDKYNAVHGAKWGTVDLAPLFGAGTPDSQDNWTSSFGGFIRITDAGLYNFSVLHDDGFFFRLRGADALRLEISNDFLNARDALGFDTDLLLDVGLYFFEMGAYERLEAGVVELSWSRDGGAWSRVPTRHLVATGDVAPVPEPGSWALLTGGLAVMALLSLGRRQRF
jgi:hypothetical protein